MTPEERCVLYEEALTKIAAVECSANCLLRRRLDKRAPLCVVCIAKKALEKKGDVA